MGRYVDVARKIGSTCPAGPSAPKAPADPLGLPTEADLLDAHEVFAERWADDDRAVRDRRDRERSLTSSKPIPSRHPGFVWDRGGIRVENQPDLRTLAFKLAEKKGFPSLIPITEPKRTVVGRDGWWKAAATANEGTVAALAVALDDCPDVDPYEAEERAAMADPATN